jgi:hypothetical protein
MISGLPQEFASGIVLEDSVGEKREISREISQVGRTLPFGNASGCATPAWRRRKHTDS